MTKIQWTEEKVLEVIEEARDTGIEFARNKLADLQSCGPKYAVMDDGTAKCVGTMLDVCGFANLNIPAKGKFYILCKKLTTEGHGFRCSRGYYGGGRLSIYGSSVRQEMSVNVAACQGQASVLKKYGIIARVESRID